MKTNQTFRGSWFVAAVIATVVTGEIIAWYLGETFGWRINPLTVAFLGVGVVAVVTSVVYDGVDIG